MRLWSNFSQSFMPNGKAGASRYDCCRIFPQIRYNRDVMRP
jgi:hypothetical protein